MQRETHLSTMANRTHANGQTGEIALPKPNFSTEKLSELQSNSTVLEEARLSSLKVLALTLLRQLESLEKQLTSDRTQELSLQEEVHRFEAAMIRSALMKTGGRQRRAARLLGVKVTTLNTKIKRHKIRLNEAGEAPLMPH